MKYCYLFILQISALTLGCFTPMLSQSQENESGSDAAIKSGLASQSLLLDIARHGDRIVTVGERGHVLYSDDLGKSWVQANVPVRSTLTSVTLLENNTAWAVGHHGVVLRSRDGGENWQLILRGQDINEILTLDAQARLKTLTSDEPIEENRLKIDQARYFLSETLLFQQEGESRPLLKVWFENQATGYILGAYGILLKTEDGGDRWVGWQQHIENDDLYHLYDITPLAESRLMVGEGGHLYKQNDNQIDWKKIISPYGGTFFGISASPKSHIALVYGLRGNIFRTTDAGDSWTPVDSGIADSILDMTWTDPDTVIAVAAGGNVLKSDDGGISFSKTTHPERKTFTALLALEGDQLIAVGQGGISRLSEMTE